MPLKWHILHQNWTTNKGCRSKTKVAKTPQCCWLGLQQSNSCGIFQKILSPAQWQWEEKYSYYCCSTMDQVRKRFSAQHTGKENVLTAAAAWAKVRKINSSCCSSLGTVRINFNPCATCNCSLYFYFDP